MKFAAAVLAFAAGALANASFEPSPTDVDNVVYTTEVVTAITTYCPEPTEIDLGTTTITVTEPTTVTITDCPCTVKVPVTTVSSVYCYSCPPSSFTTSYGSAIPTPDVTKSYEPTSTETNPPVVTAGAGKAVALSGGALAGALGLAALVL